MSSPSFDFNDKLPEQLEICARKTLEWLQKDLQGGQKLMPEEILQLSSSAELLLKLRDMYGKK
jgi:hypothetical protein